MVIVILIVSQLTFIYRADSAILVDYQQTKLEQASLLSGIPMDSAVIDTQIEVLQSRHLSEKIIKNINLDLQKDFIYESGIWTDLKIKWASLKQLFISPKKLSDEEHKNLVINTLLENLNVTRKGKSNVIAITYDSTSAELSEKIVTEITNLYLKKQKTKKAELTSKTTDWLAARLLDLQTDIQQREAIIADFKQEHNLFSTNGITQIEQQVSHLNEQLTVLKAKTAEKYAHLNKVNDMLKTKTLSSYENVLNSNVIAKLKEQETAATKNIAILSKKYGTNHPKLKNAQIELSDIKAQIYNEMQNIAHNANNEYEISLSEQLNLKNILTNLQNNFNEVKKYTIQLEQMQHELKTNRSAFENLSEQFQQNKQSDKIQENNVSVISSAIIPTEHIYPKISLILLLSFISSFFVAIGLGLLCSNYDNRLINEELENV